MSHKNSKRENFSNTIARFLRHPWPKVEGQHRIFENGVQPPSGGDNPYVPFKRSSCDKLGDSVVSEWGVYHERKKKLFIWYGAHNSHE